jgi:short-subunit dehydrogenase
MRIAVVSGGTKGIGRAIAELFLRHDFKVFISARNEATDFVHDNLVQCIADLSTKEGILNFASAIKKQVNKIDILVNNVGVFIPGSLIDEDEGCFETQINTNLASTYHLTRATIDHVRASNKPYIFNICSTASITPYMNGGSYCISKYAQLGFTKVLREELKQDKIKVSAVLPGATLTNSWAGTDLPKERFSDPSSVAQLIFAAYQLPDSTVMEEILVRPLEGDIT